MRYAKKNVLIDYLVIIVLLLNGGTLLKVMGLTGPLVLVSFFVIAALVIGSGLKTLGLVVRFAVILLLLFSIFSLVQYMSIGKLEKILSLQNAVFVFEMLTSLLVVFHFRRRPNQFVVILGSVLMWVGLHALATFLIFQTTDGQVAFVAEDGRQYYTFGYLFYARSIVLWDGSENTIVSVLGYMIRRAHGIFWEPSVFATYMNILLFLSLFVLQDKFKLILAILLIICSWSTTGLLIMSFQLLYYQFSKVHTKRGVFRAIVMIFPIALIGGFLASNLTDKVAGTGEGSAAQRYVDTIAAIQLIANHPYLGIGLDHKILLEEVQKIAPSVALVTQSSGFDVDREDVQFSNSLLILFVVFGLILGLIMVIGFMRQSLVPCHKWLFAFVNLVSVSATPILLLNFHLTFLISGLVGLLSKRKDH